MEGKKLLLLETDRVPCGNRGQQWMESVFDLSLEENLLR